MKLQSNLPSRIFENASLRDMRREELLPAYLNSIGHGLDQEEAIIKPSNGGGPWTAID